MDSIRRSLSNVPVLEGGAAAGEAEACLFNDDDDDELPEVTLGAAGDDIIV